MIFTNWQPGCIGTVTSFCVSKPVSPTAWWPYQAWESGRFCLVCCWARPERTISVPVTFRRKNPGSVTGRPEPEAHGPAFRRRPPRLAGRTEADLQGSPRNHESAVGQYVAEPAIRGHGGPSGSERPIEISLRTKSRMARYTLFSVGEVGPPAMRQYLVDAAVGLSRQTRLDILEIVCWQAHISLWLYSVSSELISSFINDWRQMQPALD